MKRELTQGTIKNKARIAKTHSKKHPKDVQKSGTVPVYKTTTSGKKEGTQKKQ